jgi:hypothetical protein
MRRSDRPARIDNLGDRPTDWHQPIATDGDDWRRQWDGSGADRPSTNAIVRAGRAVAWSRGD